MNNIIFKLILFSFLTFFIGLQAVEERDILPFYYLQEKPLKIKLKSKEFKLCRVKLKDVVQYKNTEIVDCYDVDKKFSDSINAIHKKNSKKNELNLMFIDENQKIVNPELHTPNTVYTIKSILYFKKTKTHHIELIDKNNGYYYFTYDPMNVLVVE